MSRVLLIICSVFLSFLTLSAKSKDKLVLDFRVEVTGGEERGARIVVIKNGRKTNSRTVEKTGKCKVVLDFNCEYKLILEKNGYVSKIIEVNTDVPESILQKDSRFPEKRVNVILYNICNDVDVSVFEQAIIVFGYDKNLDDFVRDNAYERSLAEKIIETEKELKKNSKKPIKSTVDRKNKKILLVKTEKLKQDKKVFKSKKVKRGKIYNKKSDIEISKREVRKKDVKKEPSFSNSAIFKFETFDEEAPYVIRHKELNNIQLKKIDDMCESFIFKAEKSVKKNNYLIAKYYYRKVIWLKGMNLDLEKKLENIGIKLKGDRKKRFQKIYNSILVRANEYYDKRAFNIARYFYLMARNLKEDDIFVKERLQEIRKSL